MVTRGALPAVDGAACVNNRQGLAECDLCVQACPTSALQIGPQGLTLKAATCTGCGGCGASCPVAAISIPGVAPLPPGFPNRDGDMLLICPRHATAGEGAICLQALGLEALAGLWLRGVRKLWLATEPCADCPNGQGLEFAGKLAALNGVLAERGLPLLEAAAAPRRRPSRLPQLGEDRADPARRSFLRLVASPVTGEATASPRALARVQGLGGQSSPTPRCAFVPVLDATRCTACHACTRLCPEGALILINEATDAAAYTCDATRCTGCGICVAACQEDAIGLEVMTQPAEGVLSLVRSQCRGCGVAFHTPGSTAPEDGLCPVCARAPHFRKLHQVLT